MSSVVPAATCEGIEKLAEAMGQSRSAALRTVIEHGFAAMRGDISPTPEASARQRAPKGPDAVSYSGLEDGHG